MYQLPQWKCNHVLPLAEMFDRGKIKLLTHCKDKHRNSSDKLEHEKKKASVNRRSRLGAWLEQIVNGVASGRSGTRKRARSYHIFTTDKWDVITTANKSAQTALIYQQKVSRSFFFFFFVIITVDRCLFLSSVLLSESASLQRSRCYWRTLGS